MRSQPGVALSEPGGAAPPGDVVEPWLLPGPCPGFHRTVRQYAAMSRAALRPSVEIGAADWIGRRLRAFDSHVVSSVVPGGFPAYVRLLHPARGAGGEQVRWTTIADWSGRRMHPLVQFHAIATAVGGESAERSPWHEEPTHGNLPVEPFCRLCSILAGQTSTPDNCWFCLWDGYGYLEDVLPNAVRTGPRVHLPQRDYMLFEGELETATEPHAPFGYSVGHSFYPQSPNLFWPHDHMWCVASEIDLYCTLVAGSETLVNALLADPALEAWRVEPDDPITYESDDVNA